MGRPLMLHNVLLIIMFCLASWKVVDCKPSWPWPDEVDPDADVHIHERRVTLQFWILALGMLVATIIMLVGCTDLCHKYIGSFMTMDNEGYTHDTTFTMPAPLGEEFSMYPPVESTPTPGSSVLYFEPLPDLSGQQQHAKRAKVNRRRLRPKVAMAWNTDGGSEESLEEAVKRDVVEDQTTLQNIIAHTRNQLARSQIHYIKELGSGWFGKVLQGEGQQVVPGHKKTKLVVQMLNEDATITDRLAFLQEGLPYRDIEHQNVLKVLGQCTHSMPYLTVLELCPFGDVKSYLRDHRVAVQSFNEKGILLKFACDMAAGLIALHEFNYVHRDFAARSCLLASDLSVKVGDYGLGESVYKDDYFWDDSGDAVPVRWLAPEALHYDSSDTSVTVGHITKASNVWSYGIALWEVMQFGTLPYSDLSNELVLRLVVKECSVRPTKPDSPISNIDRLYELMQLCWCDQPLQRPSLRQLRIMLLHLMSNKIDTSSAAFDRKWNQLLPRRPPQVTTGDKPPLMNGAPPKAGFDPESPRLDASLLTQVGSLKSDSDLSNDDRTGSVSSPVNELSLEAELSTLAGNRSVDTLHNTNDSGDNELVASSNKETTQTDEDSPSKPAHENAVAEVHRSNKATGDSLNLDDGNSDSTLDLSGVCPPPNHALVTSTPKKSAADDSGDIYDTVMSTDSTLYDTALTSQHSISQTEEELDQREQKKTFAAMLQTVTSFDPDDSDLSSAMEADSVVEKNFGDVTMTELIGTDEVGTLAKVGAATTGGKDEAESTGGSSQEKIDAVTDASDKTDMVKGSSGNTGAVTVTSDKTDISTDMSETVTNKTDTLTDKIDTMTVKSDTVQGKTDTVKDKTDIVTDKTDIVADKTDIVADKTDTVKDKTDTVADKTDTVADKTDIVTGGPEKTDTSDMMSSTDNTDITSGKTEP